MEDKIETDQQSLVEQHQQLAYDVDKVAALNKCKGLPNADSCGNDIIIVSRQ